MIFAALSFFWFLREIKSILFWLYLWQLKEYHIGRFIDHFRTEKGKRLIFNKLSFLKLILLFSLLLYVKFLPWLKYHVFWEFALLLLYFGEAIKIFYDLFRKKLKIPVLTKKIFFLILIILFFELFYLFLIFPFEISKFSFSLLVFDLFTPAIASGIVLIFQPFTVLIRSQIIQKAKKRRESLKNLIVIGITGSYGKTSTKEFLATILSEKYKVLKTKEHQNSEVGISQCILNDLKPEHEIFIVEMGAYNRGGIKLLCDITKPKIGILTGINEQHMATFGSQENIIKTKYELIESLPKDGLAVFNGNNKYCLELYQKTNLTKKIIFHTMHTNSTIVKNVCNGELCAENIKVEKEFIYFKAFSRDGGFADFKLNLIGAQNIENLLMAICCAKELGMNLKEIAKACEKIKPEQGGMKLIKTKKGLNIIDSTYSANPDGVMAHLDYLKIWEGKKVIVMPCLIELGKASIDIHKKIGEGIGQVCDLAIITTKERFKEIEEAVFAKATASQRKTEIIFMEDPKEIVERIKTFCQPGDVVILEGRIPKEIHKFLTEKL